MRLDDGVLVDDFLRCVDDILELYQILFLMGAGDPLEELKFLSQVLDTILTVDESENFFSSIHEDLAHRHVLEVLQGFDRLVVLMIDLESFEEVRVGRLEVLVLSVDDSRLVVDTGLQQRVAVYGVGSGSASSQAGSSLSVVLDSKVHSAFDQLDLHQQVLIVEFAGLSQQSSGNGERLSVFALDERPTLPFRRGDATIAARSCGG